MAQTNRNRASEAGFTLIEVLVATSLVAMVIAALATITSQWLPNWNRGMSRLQAIERTVLAIERIAADLAATEFIYAKGEGSLAAFEGTSGAVTFVRTAVGANAGVGLERVQISAAKNNAGSGILRSTMAFVPETSSIFFAAKSNRDPDVLLWGVYELLLAYAGPDRVWRDAWRQQTSLPRLVQVSILDKSQQRALTNTTSVVIKAELPVECLQAKTSAECGTDKRSQEAGKVSQISREPK